MFILMGEILFQSRLSRSLFAGLAPWAGLLPGRLLHVNVVGCSIFAAISGSSAATTQVVGRIALAELLEARLLEGHRDRLARGRRHARLPDPAVEHPDHLRRARRRLDPQAVHRGLHSGLPARRLLHGLGDDPRARSSRRSCRRTSARSSRIPFIDRLKALKELAPAIFLIAAVLGSMYRRHRDARRRAPRSACSGAIIVAALQGGLTAAGDAPDRGRRGADLLDDRHDPARRLDPRQRGSLPRHPARGRGFRRQHGALALRADRRC